MEKAGLVKKIRSSDDRRVVEIRLQPKGEELLNKAMAAGFAYGRRIIKASLTVEEIQQLDQPLKKLRDGALQELGLSAEPLPDTIDVRPQVSGRG